MAYKQTSTLSAGFGMPPYPAKMAYSGLSRQNMFNPYNAQDVESQMHHVSYLDGILESERVKFRYVKTRLENDMENERRVRLYFYNKLIKIKDEYARKEIEISEVEFKYNTIVNHNQDLQLENERLKSEVIRLQYLYSGKIISLESQLQQSGKTFEDTTAHYNAYFEKFKKYGQEYIETITFEYERKVKTLEEKLKQSDSGRRDLAMDNKRLNDMINNMRMTHEQEMRDTINRIKEYYNKKFTFINKSNEQKIKLAQDSQDGLNKKNLSLLKIIQDRERQLQEQEHSSSTEQARLQQQIGDLNSRINELNFVIKKMYGDLSNRNVLIDRSAGYSGQELIYLRQQLQQRKQENDMLTQTIGQLNQRVLEQSAYNERRRTEWNDRCRNLEMYAMKYREKYDKLCAVLSNKINYTISHVSHSRQ